MPFECRDSGAHERSFVRGQLTYVALFGGNGHQALSIHIFRLIGDAIGVLERRRSIFPRAPLHKASPQRRAARHQTVVGVRQGESGQETKDYAA